MLIFALPSNEESPVLTKLLLWHRSHFARRCFPPCNCFLPRCPWRLFSLKYADRPSNTHRRVHDMEALQGPGAYLRFHTCCLFGRVSSISLRSVHWTLLRMFRQMPSVKTSSKGMSRQKRGNTTGVYSRREKALDWHIYL